MADKSLITQEQLQSDFEDFYSQKIYPFLNGATHAGFTPVGSVIAIMGNEAPNHYLVCDGTLYTIADYPQLTAYFEDQFGSVNYFGGNGTTTFAVPDLRGEFLRGTGTNSHTNQGSGANVGVHQDGTQVPTFFISLKDNSNKIGGYYMPNTNSAITNMDSEIKIVQTRTGIMTSTLSETWSTSTSNDGYTSRPTNTSVLWCIAYENTYIDGSGQSSGGGHKIQNEGDLEPLTQRKTMLLNEPLVASDDAEGGNTVIDVDSDVDLSVIHAPGTAGQVEGHIYSTSETVVGRWIDGKTIYERSIPLTYDFQSIPSNSWTTLQPIDISVDTMIDGYVITGDKNSPSKLYYLTLSYDTTNKQIKALHTRNINLQIAIGSYIVVQYTKTTDTVQS